jgi:hypothetical protein
MILIISDSWILAGHDVLPCPARLHMVAVEGLFDTNDLTPFPFQVSQKGWRWAWTEDTDVALTNWCAFSQTREGKRNLLKVIDASGAQLRNWLARNLNIVSLHKAIKK